MASSSNGPVATLISEKLNNSFSPMHLDVLNESNRHNVPPGSESHFKVVIVSDSFDGKRLIARHRMVNEVLADELKNSIHALSIHTYSEAEWQESPEVQRTPNCKG
ncbi:BolA/IbaG family iron-sulfur metabolism protein [Shewanella sp. 202IG2-18]|uniref:BolA family protein n=1 Tax=Parashewanella hymeniacidonis TaxID=2807618 RepID=UPI00195FDF4B|nr:BolA/IbaG family iron-sulfur metabolism protein [Parashewanella hymeniacidonis]MBM7074482.1 BolA/IbaG family iron-sulfur metabolism protein [Parashewanella hymeniacidonis]